MDNLSFLPMSRNVKSNTVWRPLFSNLWYIQVPLTETPSVLDLYTFDTISPGGGECNWKGHISVPKDKPLNLCNIECHRNHDPEHVRKKTLRISNSVRKTIANRVANVTPSMLATELMNNSKILDTTSNTPLNHVQLTSTRFAPNLESIQNALKYDKKLHHPSVSELEK
ncbi:23807_t:CDS:2, partial [Gigaspora rosea]